MKKTLSLILAITLCFTLCACSSNDTEEETTSTETNTEVVTKYSLGETVSTNLAEFTLENSSLTYYVSNNSTNYVEPTDTPNTLFAASVGHCYVSVTFTITNKDRGGSISFASFASEWDPKWSVSYNGVDYPVKGYSLNDNAGTDYINLGFSAIVEKGTGNTIRKHTSQNYLLSAGETITIRTFGIIDVDPQNLTDGFEFTVGVPNSNNEYEYFTYVVPARS
ncbi:MAG: hypothetical protein IJN49_03080 [Clostridia bacterium]|nr:hypothetical protein [Clostridia bacterium]